MKRKSLVGLVALMALSVGLTSCEDPVAEESGGNDTSTVDDDSTATTLQSITISDEYKYQTIGIGEVIYLNTNWYTLSPSGLSASQRRTTLSIESGAEYFEENDGDFEAIAAGTAVFRISSRNDESIYDTFTVEVIETYFARTDGYASMDLEHENDETNPYVMSRGVTTDLIIAGISSTKWYAEVDITIHSVASGENYPKMGIFSRTTDGSLSRVYYFLNAEQPSDNSSWSSVGVCEVSESGDWAWNSGVTNAVARHSDFIYTSSNSYGYEDTFKMGMARDGLTYYLYFEGEYIMQFDILESLIPADQESNIGFFQFNSTVTFANYYSTDDETYVDDLIDAITETKTFEWAAD